MRGLLRSGVQSPETDRAIADAIRGSVKDKWIGHQINTAKFVPPPRPMYSIGG
jgi:cyclic pyranopterin phosphate synthase